MHRRQSASYELLTRSEGGGTGVSGPGAHFGFRARGSSDCGRESCGGGRVSGGRSAERRFRLTRSTWRTAWYPSRRVALLASSQRRAFARRLSLPARSPKLGSFFFAVGASSIFAQESIARLPMKKRTDTVSKTVRVSDPPRSTRRLIARPRRARDAARVPGEDISRRRRTRVPSRAPRGGGARLE